MEGTSVNNLVNSLGKELPSTFMEDSEIVERLKTEASYYNAVQSQEEDVRQLRSESLLKFPKDFDFLE
jgi:tRNA U34 5-carboxymethylaminomethyl modifying enzyme MnmG/GidA